MRGQGSLVNIIPAQREVLEKPTQSQAIRQVPQYQASGRNFNAEVLESFGRNLTDISLNIQDSWDETAANEAKIEWMEAWRGYKTDLESGNGFNAFRNTKDFISKKGDEITKGLSLGARKRFKEWFMFERENKLDYAQNFESQRARAAEKETLATYHEILKTQLANKELDMPEFLYGFDDRKKQIESVYKNNAVVIGADKEQHIQDVAIKRDVLILGEAAQKAVEKGDGWTANTLMRGAEYMGNLTAESVVMGFRREGFSPNQSGSLARLYFEGEMERIKANKTIEGRDIARQIVENAPNEMAAREAAHKLSERGMDSGLVKIVQDSIKTFWTAKDAINQEQKKEMEARAKKVEEQMKLLREASANLMARDVVRGARNEAEARDITHKLYKNEDVDENTYIEILKSIPSNWKAEAADRKAKEVVRKQATENAVIQKIEENTLATMTKDTAITLEQAQFQIGSALRSDGLQEMITHDESNKIVKQMFDAEKSEIIKFFYDYSYKNPTRFITGNTYKNFMKPVPLRYHEDAVKFVNEHNERVSKRNSQQITVKTQQQKELSNFYSTN